MAFSLLTIITISGLSAGTTNNSWTTPQVNQSGTGLSSVPKQVNVNGTTNLDNAAVRTSSAPATIEPAPHSKSYMEDDINDMPPNPNQEPSKPVLAPRPKPWEVPQPQPIVNELSSPNDENGVSSDLNGKAYDSSEPWWKKKTVKITELDPEAEEPRKQQFPYSISGSHDRPIQRSWVPPQPPSVVIPEAATAIRQPKKQQSGEIARSDDGENSVGAAAEDTITEPEASAAAAAATITESNRSEIEEVREVGVEMS